MKQGVRLARAGEGEGWPGGLPTCGPGESEGQNPLLELSSSLNVGTSSFPRKKGAPAPSSFWLGSWHTCLSSPPIGTPVASTCPRSFSLSPQRPLRPTNEIQDSAPSHLGTSAPTVVGYWLSVVTFHLPSFRTLQKQSMGRVFLFKL